MNNESKKNDEKRKIVEIFNLVFPTDIDQLEIGDYVFRRIENYKEAIKGLSYSTSFINDDIHATPRQGTNQITAFVELPKNERKSVLPWSETDLTQLDDILFLLTLFKSRWIFIKDEEDKRAIRADSRKGIYGGILENSLENKTGYFNPVKNLIKQAIDEKEKNDFCCKVSVGFDKSISEVLNVISRDDWQEEYDRGYFLLLYRTAMRTEYLEATFALCWTIWEHIFSLKHSDWLDPKAIRNMSVENKIAYILNQYFSKNLDKDQRKNLGKLIKNRHRIVHFGKVRDDGAYEKSKDELKFFIELTEYLIAIILELQPTNIFDTEEKLEKFLNPK